MDVKGSDAIRFVQLTLQGSDCSIHIGEGTSTIAPGSLKGLILVVDDAAEAKAQPEAKGIKTSPIEEQSWCKHVYFSNSGGNSGTLQEAYVRSKQ